MPASPPGRVVGTAFSPNENKMSDGGRRRASLAVRVWKSSQNVDAQRSDVRSIAWLGLWSWVDWVRQNNGTTVLPPLAAGFPCDAVAAVWVCCVKHVNLGLAHNLVSAWSTM